MGSAQTGLNPDKVNSAIDTAKNSSNEVMTALENGFKDVFKSLKENWGTQDGKVWVEGDCTTAVNNISDKVAETLTKIGEVISAVGNAQLTDTTNTQKVKAAGAVDKKHVKGELNDKLNNGYVGVYDELTSDLTAKEEALITSVDAALAALQTKVIAATDVAFNLTGAADKVSAECTIYINRVKNIIDSGLKSLNSDISANVAKAESFVKDIQNAGLRGAADASGC